MGNGPGWLLPSTTPLQGQILPSPGCRGGGEEQDGRSQFAPTDRAVPGCGGTAGLPLKGALLWELLPEPRHPGTEGEELPHV